MKHPKPRAKPKKTRPHTVLSPAEKLYDALDQKDVPKIKELLTKFKINRNTRTPLINACYFHCTEHNFNLPLAQVLWSALGTQSCASEWLYMLQVCSVPQLNHIAPMLLQHVPSFVLAQAVARLPSSLTQDSPDPQDFELSFSRILAVLDILAPSLTPKERKIILDRITPPKAHVLENMVALEDVTQSYLAKKSSKSKRKI